LQYFMIKFEEAENMMGEKEMRELQILEEKN
jgi:hypothetical protein